VSDNTKRTAEEQRQIAESSPLYKALEDKTAREEAFKHLHRIANVMYPMPHQKSFMKEIVANTIVRAIGQEGTQYGWDPKKEPLHERLIRAFDNERSDQRRAAERRPVVHLAKHPQRVSEAPNPQEEIELGDDEQLRAQMAEETYALLKSKTEGNVTLRVIDHMRAGVTKHKDIADKIGLPLPVILNACKRIRRAAETVWKRHQDGEKA
jgi:hypothetical protein